MEYYAFDNNLVSSYHYVAVGIDPSSPQTLSWESSVVRLGTRSESQDRHRRKRPQSQSG